jgi:asparagine synthase (glutamine-hydrolysing)
MCGIAGVVGVENRESILRTLNALQRHRGPDHEGLYLDPHGTAGLAHARLSIIDRSIGGAQPMHSFDGRYSISFNGEIYNYVELRRELDYPFRTQTDTEVILAAWQRWGLACLDRFVGMFAFLLWDARERELFAVRDRFGVKPVYLARAGEGLVFASETAPLRAALGITDPDPVAWATYLALGLSDHSERTFWTGVEQLAPGHWLRWREGVVSGGCWYDLRDRTSQPDERALESVKDEYLSLLTESVRLRFRSDVPVGINLSGGLDSSTLLGLVQLVQGAESDVKAFTFVCGDPDYDELPWVQRMLLETRHPNVVCELSAKEVPELAPVVQSHQDAPFGGIPTLAYARVFERARAEGVIVLLDGQGMDEQWAGYDYYDRAAQTETDSVVQGTVESPLRPECLSDDFRASARAWQAPNGFDDPVLRLQYRDLRHVKIPRALRYNDNVSMLWSTELREPFLDHRLVELALRQPRDRKIRDGVRKWFLRDAVAPHLPVELVQAPKRPLQTPQREWLRGPLREWAHGLIEAALSSLGGRWMKPRETREAWQRFLSGQSDNSFYVWQWITVGLMLQDSTVRPSRS